MKQKPILSNDDYYDLLPTDVRFVIAHAAFDVKDCEWVHAIYQAHGSKAAIAEVVASDQKNVGSHAYNAYGIKHPQAVPPNLMAFRRNA